MRNIKRFFHEYQGLAISLSIALGSLAVIIFILYPFGTHVYGLYDETQTLGGDVRDLGATASLLGSFEEKQLQTQLVSLVAALPLDKSLPSVFTTLEAVAAHTGLSVEDISLGNTGLLATEAAKLASAEEKKLGVGIQPVVFSGVGKSSHLNAFLGEISSVKRLMRVNFFDASFSEDDTVRVKMSLSGFYAPLSGGSKAGASATVTKLSAKETDALTTIVNMPDSAT